MLVLPDDIGLYEDLISRWESISVNLVNSKTFQDKQAKVDYIENLLGEIEKELFQQCRMAYPEEYQGVVQIADDPHNVISQIRRIITLEDPYQGSTAMQDRAYADLERLTCTHVKDLIAYMNDFKVLEDRARLHVPGHIRKILQKKCHP